jgi:hypothetical protein
MKRKLITKPKIGPGEVKKIIIDVVCVLPLGFLRSRECEDIRFLGEVSRKGRLGDHTASHLFPCALLITDW